MSSRRTLLKVGLAGSALLAVGGVGLGLRATTRSTPGRALKVLDPVSFSVLAAVAARVAPGTASFPSATDLGIAHDIDDLMATLPPAVPAELAQALQLLENALVGFMFDQRLQTFTGSSAATQDAVLETWRTSRLNLRRQVYKAVRGLCASAYYARPEVYLACGYPGPPTFRLPPPLDLTDPDSIALHQAAAAGRAVGP